MNGGCRSRCLTLVDTSSQYLPTNHGERSLVTFRPVQVLPVRTEPSSRLLLQQVQRKAKRMMTIYLTAPARNLRPPTTASLSSCQISRDLSFVIDSEVYTLMLITSFCATGRNCGVGRVPLRIGGLDLKSTTRLFCV